MLSSASWRWFLSKLRSRSKRRNRKPGGRQSSRPCLEPLEERTLPAGTWTALTHVPTGTIGTAVMLLMTDGTVLVQGDSNSWFKLTPDNRGSYLNGTWSQVASQGTARLYGGTAVLPNGKLLYMGGEYTGTSTNQTEINTGEIYDPVANTWSPVANFPAMHFGDGPLEVLPNGNVIAGDIDSAATYLYNPTTNAWSTGPTKIDPGVAGNPETNAEEDWVKLPGTGGNLLDYELNASEGVLPGYGEYLNAGSNMWTATGRVPATLSNTVEYELGPGVLLPNGMVLQVGADGMYGGVLSSTALYNPRTNQWSSGPSIPNSYTADDAPACVLPNGQVIFAADASTEQTPPSDEYLPPTVLFDYDPTTNSIAQLSLPGGLDLSATAAYVNTMLMLPSGEMLLSDGTNQLWDYNPGTSGPAAWQPTITSITPNGGGTYTLTGTQINGLDEGAYYGDDEQMASNYPIIELKSGTTVRFARTFNWTSVVATGSTPETTQFTLPTGLPAGTYQLTVIANGIASAPVTFGALSVSPATLANWTANQGGYHQTITASGGKTPYTFAVSAGTLPAGLSLSTGGVLAGTPTTAGTYNFTVTATDANSETGGQSYTVIINPAVTITPTTLPSWTVSFAGYNQTLVATGGTGALSLSLTSGTLPTGLSLNAGTGVLSGTPSALGTYTFAVTATDSLGAAASQNYTVNINPALAIVSTSLSNWTVNQAGYSQTIGTTGGGGTIIFSKTSGTLPTGMTLSAGGVLSGTPTSAKTSMFTVTATDSLSETSSQAYTVTILPAVNITTASLPNWTANLAGYSQTLATSGGTGPFTFGISAGTLPTGLILTSAGVLSGTPSAAGSFSFTIRVTDSLGAFGTKAYTVTVAPAVAITTTSLANWTVSQPGYSLTLRATGGTGSVTFSQTGGTLPVGLSLTSAGVLSGTPTTAASYPFTVTATDSLGATSSQTYTAIINPAVTLAPGLISAGAVGVAYYQSFDPAGGTGSVILNVTGITGAIPGLFVPTTGTNGLTIAGTPTAAGKETFKMTATDQVGAAVSITYSLVVFTITPTTLPAVTAGSPYLQTISVSGGTTPYTLALSSFSSGGTGLTAGQIALNPTSGTIVVNGTPTGAGTGSFTVRITDASGASLAQPFSFTVNPGPASRLVVTAPAQAAAKGTFRFTVTAEDLFNNPASSYTGTVQFTSSDLAAVLPADMTLTAGVGTFTATFSTLGPQTITAMDTSMHALVATSGFVQVVNPAVVYVNPIYSGLPGTPLNGHTFGYDAFSTLAQGISIVAAGGTVIEDAPIFTYSENLVINKSLTLQGRGSASTILMGSGSGVGLTISGVSVTIAGFTVEDFASGLTAGSAVKNLVLSDVRLTGNTSGGTLTGVSGVTFFGNAGDETLTTNGSQFGREGDNLINYSGVGVLELDGTGGNNTLDLSGVAGTLGVFLSAPGYDSGFAGTTTLPGVVFNNIDFIVGNGTGLLAGESAAATWSLYGPGEPPAFDQYASGGRTVSFEGFTNLYGGAAADSFVVQGDAASLTLNGQGGGDSFVVALGYAYVGPVTINAVGGSGTNTATINGGDNPNDLTLTANAVTLTDYQYPGTPLLGVTKGPATLLPVYYSGLQALTVNAGGNTDAIAVEGTALGTSTTIEGTGIDTYIVSSPAGLLNTMVSPVTLGGGPGSYLDISEANRASADTLYVTNDAIISGTGSFAPISYSGMGTVILVAGDGNNVIDVFSTAAGTGYGLYTGTGSSSFIVSSPTSTLDSMAGPIAVVAGAGANLLYVSEAGSSTPDTMTLTSSGVTTTTGLTLSYTSPAGTFGRGVFLVTGSANDTVLVQGTARGSSNGITLGNGNNNVVITSPTSTLNTMAGPIGVQGGTGTNLLYVSDAGDSQPDQLFVSGVSVQGAGLFVSYVATPGGTFGRGVDVVGASAGSQIYVVGQLAGSPIGVFGGSSNDIFNIYVTAITFYNLSVNGQGGNDRLHLYDLSGGVEQITQLSPTTRQAEFTYSGGLPSLIWFSGVTLV